MLPDIDTIDTRIPNIPAHFFEYTINPRAFINAHNFATLQDLVQEVRRIDNDNEAYKEMYLQPLFLDDFNPYVYYSKKLEDFLDSIFIQNPKEALRRGSDRWVVKHRKIMYKGSTSPKKLLKNALKYRIQRLFDQ